jgi:glucosamine kinase
LVDDLRMILCIDAGASSAKWTLQHQAGFSNGAVGPITGHLFNDEAKALAYGEIAKIASAVGKIDEIVLGITGLDKETVVANEIVELIQKTFGLAKTAITIMNDMELAYSAVLAPAEGVLIYAGTGAIATQLDAAGNFLRAGGWGFHLGDFGGGYSIGAAALRYVTSQWDQGKDLRIFIYGNGRSAIASVAPIVGELADAENEIAQLLVQDAGYSLAELTQHVIDRTGSNKVVAMGGTFKVSSLLLQNMNDALGLQAEFVDEDISQLWLMRNR